MSTIEKQILSALIRLEEAVQQISQSSEEKPDLMGLFSEIDSLTATLPQNTDPELLHVLHKKSYQKARLFLQGRGTENAKGVCHH